MHPRKQYAPWEKGRDMLREWAAMEGKSAAMSEDLYRGSVRPQRRERNALAAIYSVAHAMAWALEVWRMFRST